MTSAPRISNVRRFCVITTGRSGSTALMAALATYDDVIVPSKVLASDDNELIHPARARDFARELSAQTGRRVDDPDALVDAYFEAYQAPFVGFKTMPNRHRNPSRFIRRSDIRFITLMRRDIASTVASFMLAAQKNTWRRDGGRPSESWEFTQSARRLVEENVRYILTSDRLLQAIPDAIRLTYEDVCSDGFQSEELDAFFGRHVALDRPQPPTRAADYVVHWAQFESCVNDAAERVRSELRRPEGRM